jgi:hypothetical protein
LAGQCFGFGRTYHGICRNESSRQWETCIPAIEDTAVVSQEFSDETTLPGPRNPVETSSGLPSPKTKRGSVMMEATTAALLFVSTAVFFAHAYDALQKD